MRFGFRALAIAALGLLITVSAGCGAAATARTAPPAANGIQGFVKALRSDDPRPAYDMLAADVRQDVTFDEFALVWKQTKAERDDRARALEEGLKGNPDLGERSSVRYQDGKIVHLEREDGVWRLDSALVTRIHAGRPHDAVKIFAEGLAGRDFEHVMRILSARRRDGIRRQVDTFTDSLIRNLEGAIHFIGTDGAELRWEDGDTAYRIVLKKEGDEWRVDDVHIRTRPPEKKPSRTPAED